MQLPSTAVVKKHSKVSSNVKNVFTSNRHDNEDTKEHKLTGVLNKGAFLNSNESKLKTSSNIEVTPKVIVTTQQTPLMQDLKDEPGERHPTF